MIIPLLLLLLLLLLLVLHLLLLLLLLHPAGKAPTRQPHTVVFVGKDIVR